MDISVNDVREQLPVLLPKLDEAPITITQDGKPVGILISPEEYTRLRQSEAYLRMLHIAHSLEESGVDEAGKEK
jgi:prevent-host-death family protein